MPFVVREDTTHPLGCAVEEWLYPNPGFAQHVVEHDLMTPHSGKYKI